MTMPQIAEQIARQVMGAWWQDDQITREIGEAENKKQAIARLQVMIDDCQECIRLLKQNYYWGIV
jgi:hypothetical protein